MATDGIPDVYVKLQEIVGVPVSPQDIDVLASVLPEPPSSFVGRFLVNFAPDGFRATVEQVDMIQGLMECLHHGWVSEAGPGMRHGVWDHFKGGLYCSLGVGRHAETDALEVEYISLFHATKHHRRCEQWNEVVQWPDGKYRSRFVYRGPDLESCDPPPFKTTLSDKLRSHVARTMIQVLKV